MTEHGMNFDQASELAKQKIVYTNHTLVAAGNNSVPVNLLTTYLASYAESLGISLDRLLSLGITPDGQNFSMTTFALSISRKANGVSQLHSQLSQQLWPNHTWTNITNGVHLPTWQDERFKVVSHLTDQELWATHLDNKRQLKEFIKLRTGFTIDDGKMIITWSRRLAGYKRLNALFDDLPRLKNILSQADRPVQLLIAGKTHVSDIYGKKMLEQIIKVLAAELADEALFIPNYDLDVARMLAQGSDVWLNVPEMNKEACGTSGMKAISNGVLQCTVPDGWANEVDWYGKGWTLPGENVSQHLYQILEQQIVPLFYDRDSDGVPETWTKMMRASIELSIQYSAHRMMNDYLDKLY